MGVEKRGAYYIVKCNVHYKVYYILRSILYFAILYIVILHFAILHIVILHIVILSIVILCIDIYCILYIIKYII